MNKLYRDGPVVLVLPAKLDYRTQYKYSVHSLACLVHPLSIHSVPYMATHSYSGFRSISNLPTVGIRRDFGHELADSTNWIHLMNFRPSSNIYRTGGGDPVNPNYKDMCKKEQSKLFIQFFWSNHWWWGWKTITMQSSLLFFLSCVSSIRPRF